MATKPSSNFGDFTFHGDQNTYSELIAKHDQDLAISQIGYLKNAQEITRKLQKPVYPARVTAGPENTREYEFNKQLDTYKTKNQAYQKNVERVEEDFGVAIGLFTKRLTTVISTEIEGIISLEADQPSRTKYENMLKFIFDRYGPRNISDIETLKAQLRRADDSQGYKHLLYLHRHIQNQLQKIHRRDLQILVQS
jgi:hypothetical protein